MKFDNTYACDLPGFYASCQPSRVAQPTLLFFNHQLADELGLVLPDDRELLAQIFSGNQLPEGAEPIAQAYSGHQFGRFSPQLGDGRAHLLGEVIDARGQRRDIALKGSGTTPFSRRGDGKAAVGPMLREVLIGEAMHALGIPTTRALAVVATGEPVYREQVLPGAVLTRVAASHLRVGTFQYFSAHGNAQQVRQLADYAIARHYPEALGASNPYLDLLRQVAQRQARLIAQWMHVGFIHGVMNTDNMGVPGESIDFGPCAFMEAYDPGAVFSSIDAGGRYAYQQQPMIGQWNLSRLAETLLPLIHENDDEAVRLATEVIEEFISSYQKHWLSGLQTKLGLSAPTPDSATQDKALGESWLDLLHAQQVDFTLAWRRLADAAEGNEEPLSALFAGQPGLSRWLERWRSRCAEEDAGQNKGVERANAMRRVNPWLIPRNHNVEAALSAASDRADLRPFRQLLEAVRNPFEENPNQSQFAQPAPAEFMAEYQTFCGT